MSTPSSTPPTKVLNAAAKEWRPPASSASNPGEVLLSSEFQLPPASEAYHRSPPPDTQQHQHAGGLEPRRSVYVYDEESGEGVLHEDGYEEEDNGRAPTGAYTNFTPNRYGRGAREPADPAGGDGGAAAGDHPQMQQTSEDALYAMHMALFGPTMMGEQGLPFVPSLPGKDGGDIDWDVELKNFLAAQAESIQQQLEEQRQREEGHRPTTGGTGQQVQQQQPSGATSNAFPPLPSTEDQRAAAAFWAKGPSTVRGGSGGGGASSVGGHQAPSSTGGGGGGGGGGAGASSSASNAPLTANGKHRWPKQSKAQVRQELAQKTAFEAFANALLHSTSPFMAPLREQCRSSLPHLKLDQRFGKRGAPHTAVAQFVVAPIVVNYRPRHFHELSPGDLMEFHYDFAQVLKRLQTANCIAINYGPEWKAFAVPFGYLGCRDYKAEVLRLCPNEVPNSRSEAVYEDDIVKDISDLVLAIEELQPLRKWSMVQCMSKRVNLAPLYEAFETIFAPVGNYQIQIRELHHAPSQFLIKTSQQVLDLLPNKGHSGIVLHGDDQLWYDLPNVANSFQSGRSLGHVGGGGSGGGTVVDEARSATTTSPPPAPPLAPAPAVSGNNAVLAADAVVPVASTVASVAVADSRAVNSKPGSVGPSPQQQPSPQPQAPTAAPKRSSNTRRSSGATRQADLVLYGVCAAAIGLTALAVHRLLKS